MTRLLLVIALICAGAAASGLGPRLECAGSRPDLFLVMALMGTLALQRNEGLIFAWFAGLTKDLFSTGALGASAMLFLLVAVAMRELRARYRLDALPVVFLTAATASFAAETAYLFGLLISFPSAAFWAIMGHLPLAAAYTGLVAVVAFVGLRWAVDRAPRRPLGA